MTFALPMMRSPKCAAARRVVPVLSPVRDPRPSPRRSARLPAIALSLLVWLIPGCDGGTTTQLTLDLLTGYPSSAGWVQGDDGTLRTDGREKGYLASQQSFGDSVVTLEYRFDSVDGALPTPQANTGLLLLIDDADRVWPVCIEAQGKWVEMGELKSNGGLAAVKTTLRRRQRDAARRSPGQWNTLTARVEAGRVAVSLNGVLVSTSDTAGRTGGRIGVQSEGHPLTVRRFEVRPL